jgi:hypothetical protein
VNKIAPAQKAKEMDRRDSDAGRQSIHRQGNGSDIPVSSAGQEMRGQFNLSAIACPSPRSLLFRQEIGPFAIWSKAVPRPPSTQSNLLRLELTSGRRCAA